MVQLLRAQRQAIRLRQQDVGNGAITSRRRQCQHNVSNDASAVLARMLAQRRQGRQRCDDNVQLGRRQHD